MSSGIGYTPSPPAFDTLGAALELENAGFARQQAEALAKTIARAHTAAATPQDIANAVSEIKRAIAALEKRQDVTEAKLEALQKQVAAIREKMATKEDLDKLRANLVTHDQLAAALAKQKNELLVWMFSFGLGIAALSITITQLLD